MTRQFIDLIIIEIRSKAHRPKKLSLKALNKKKLLENRMKNLINLKN